MGNYISVLTVLSEITTGHRRALPAAETAPRLQGATRRASVCGRRAGDTFSERRSLPRLSRTCAQGPPNDRTIKTSRRPPRDSCAVNLAIIKRLCDAQ